VAAGTGVGVYGKDRGRIISNRFIGLTGSAVSVWSEGVGADYTLIRSNRIDQTKTLPGFADHVARQRGRRPRRRPELRTTIRSNIINQGSGSIGWFGIELKQSKGAQSSRRTRSPAERSS
jgi:hypothetical protein